MTSEDPGARSSATSPTHDQIGGGRSRIGRAVSRLIDPEEPELLVELLDQANKLNMRSAMGTPATVIMIVATLWTASPHPGLIAWGCGAIFVGAFHVSLHIWYRRRSSERTPTFWRRRYTVAMGVGGALWGAISLVALPDSDQQEYQALVALYLIAVMAANSIFSSHQRRLFLAFQVPVAGVGATGLILADTTFTGMLAVVVIFSLCFSFGLYDQSNSAAVSAVRLAHRNSALLVELRAERVRIEEANAELRDANTQLEHQAAHDSLTDLANRHRFRAELQAALVDARSSDSWVGVAFFDLDRFKLVNDSLGHLVGDELLVAVAERVGSVLRRGDLLGRLGGDEFTVLMPHLRDEAEAVAFAERIRLAFRRPFTVGTREMTITTSVGVTLNTDPGDTADDLLRHADIAMYRAKAIGRDCVAMFDDSMREDIARRVGDEAEIRGAFAQGEIISWFQPEVDLITGRIIGAESLARWKHPTRGVLSAGHFVPLVEDCGLLADLSEMTARSATAARAFLRDVVDPSFRIRLNVSASQIMDLALLDSFLEQLAEHDLDPRSISVEVTETALIHDLAAARVWLETARALGITVALDDFGTGYSSLAMLSQLPLDGVKIDLGFVREMATSARARAVVAATIELAAGLGLQVVAEGVENEEQAEALRVAGVRRAQGFHFAPAVPIETLHGWLADGPPWMSRHSSTSTDHAVLSGLPAG